MGFCLLNPASQIKAMLAPPLLCANCLDGGVIIFLIGKGIMPPSLVGETHEAFNKVYIIR